MTDDLVKRLRVRAEFTGPYSALWDEAADHIEKLEAALRELSCKCTSNCDWERDDICPSWTARKALEGKDG